MTSMENNNENRHSILLPEICTCGIADKQDELDKK